MTEQDSVPLKASNRLYFILRLLVSVGLLAVLALRLDPGQFLLLMDELIWVWLIPPFLLFWIGMALTSWRWQAILSDFQIRERVGTLFWLTILGFFWNNFLPSTVGGDGYRFLRLRARHPGRDAAAFSSVFLDRVYGFLTLLILHFVFIPFFWQMVFRDPWLKWIEAAILLVMLAAALVWIARGRLDAFSMMGEGKISRLIQNALGKVRKVIRLIEQQQPATFWRASMSSLIFLLLNGLALWCFYLMLGNPPDLALTVYASTLASVIGALPVTVNGLGLMEAMYVLLFSPTGLDRESILLAALISRGMNLVIAIGGGVGYMLEEVFSSFIRRAKIK